MCGFAAYLKTKTTLSSPRAAIERACQQMRMRGPDAFGTWAEDDESLVLGHRRLAVIDLDRRATQPMHSGDERYVIVFNGEIYNFRQLRRELEAEGVHFATQSDTEVLLCLFAREGERMLQRLRGMFSFAIWDRRRHSLFCARDPYGIKPLYVAKVAGGWMVASQVKAILASGLVSRQPDALGQAGFWLLGSVPEPHTWFADIRAIPAGSWMRLEANGAQTSRTYWDIGESWRSAPACNLSRGEVQEIVREKVADSVKHHLVADVPIGAFLSGGIDSGSLVAHMKSQAVSQLHGVTVAFDEFRGSADDEAPIAKQIALQYGVSHHVRYIGQAEFEGDLGRILDDMDQPSIDGINTWYASKAVAELGMKVVISGVGGDELAFGYPSFRQVPKLVRRWRQIEAIPGARALVKHGLRLQTRRTGNPKWSQLSDYAGTLAGAYFLRRGLYGVADLPRLMQADLFDTLHRSPEPEQLIETMSGPLSDHPALAIGQLESMLYMRNQLLRDSDWASMAHSIELRTPLADAWLLRDLAPVMQTFLRYPGKELLGRSPPHPLDSSIINRPKTGFGMPIGAWVNQSRLAEGAPAASGGGHAHRKLASLVASYVYS